MRIFGWMADESGCGYYRVACPLWALEQRGHDVAWSCALPPQALAGGVDAVIGQRILKAGPSRLWQQMAREHRAMMVYELDDDLFALDPSNPAHGYYVQGVQPMQVHVSSREVHTVHATDPQRQDRIRENIAVADLVTVSTEPLAEVVRPINPNVVVVPNCVPTSFLAHERIRNDGVITVGWRGSATHARDFGEIAKPLRAFLQRHAERVELHCIGADHTGRVSSRRARTRHTGWLKGVEPFIRVVDFDLAVIPLRPSPFNDSKSDLAMLEMAALGIPSLASATGPYPAAVAEGAPPGLATSPAEWTALLESLLDDDVRHAWGEQARTWAATRTIEGNAYRWERAYERAGRVAA